MTQTQTQTQTQNKGNRQDEHKPPIEILINKKGEPDLRINSREGIDILAEAVAQDAYTRTRINGGREVTVDEDMIHLAYLNILSGLITSEDEETLKRHNALYRSIIYGVEVE